MEDRDDIEDLRHKTELLQQLTLKRIADTGPYAESQGNQRRGALGNVVAAVVWILYAPVALMCFLFGGKRAWVTFGVMLALYTIGYLLGYAD